MFAPLALAALILDSLLGYPQGLVRRIGHPVTWMGALIAWLDRAWNRPELSDTARRVAGVVSVVTLLTATLIVSMGLVAVAALLPALAGFLLLALAAGTLLAQGSLDTHVRAVAGALETGGLEAGRRAVSQIVGRDPESLDEAGVARAAIESLAENFSDGVVAPLFWMVIAGLPGAALYKAINTADSMIGHKSERHAAFGWVAARLDDLVNLPASRLAACWIILAAALFPGTSAHAAISAVARDAHRHRSPNAGWPESAMAGALGLRLAGPRIYGGKTVDDHWMGNGRPDADATDIWAALYVYRTACLIQALALVVLAGLTMPL